MRGIRAILAAVGLLASAPPAAMAQADNAPPTVEIIKWEVFRPFTGEFFTVFDAGTPGLDERVLIDLFNHEELDQVTVTLDVVDPDWTTEEMGEQEEVFVRFRAFSLLFRDFPPEPPPIREADDDFFGVTEDMGFQPPEGETQLDPLLEIPFEIPEFEGKNQARLLGLIDWDVSYLIEICVSNEKDPEETDIGLLVTCDLQLMFALESPFLVPPNPQPIADAGADQIVEAGSTVRLDASRTFDGFNVGFDAGDANVVEKDTLLFTWEWISGPVRVDPVQTRVTDPTATVTLTETGTYVYRVIVDDQFNALPASDSVSIEVVAELPDNLPPTALIVGPARPVLVGSIITLDGTRSSDPDGDTLRFRWRQTNELGGPVEPDQLQKVFQPLSGLDQAVSTWQALSPGTFYFRLLVDDGEFQSTTTFSVTVVASTAGARVNRERDNATGGSDSGAPPEAAPSATPSLCGAGLLPAGLATLAVGLTGRRRRSR